LFAMPRDSMALISPISTSVILRCGK